MGLIRRASDTSRRLVGRLDGRRRDGRSAKRGPERTRQELHQYWSAPPDEGNRAEAYAVEPPERSEFLVRLIRKHLATDAELLEIGCNVGRNLEHLRRAGFGQITGIELSARALEVMRTRYPELPDAATIINSPVEDAITSIAHDSFDLVFTMAVLEHIHPDSEQVFAEIARVTRKLVITIEDEHGVSERHFPRDYGEVFGALGLTQIEESHEVDGLPGFTARVFRAG